jgi:hypothetical protein
MNYIELFGISASGKTYIKKKIIRKLNKNFQVANSKEIIIKFYLKNSKMNYLDYLKSVILLIFHSRFIDYLRYFFRPEGKTTKENNKIRFHSLRRKSYLKIIDKMRLNDHYQNILKSLEKKFKISEKNNFYRIIIKETNNLKQDYKFKVIFKKWFLENIILIEIQKKGNNLHCVTDGGLIHKIFFLFTLKKNKYTFIKKIIKDLQKYGELYLVSTNLKNIYKRSLDRNKKSKGFVYKDYNEIVKEYDNLKIFEKLIKKKISYKKIRN